MPNQENQLSPPNQVTYRDMHILLFEDSIANSGTNASFFIVMIR